MDKLYLWLAEKEPLYSPGSEMPKAIRYAMKNWQAMTRFIHDPPLPPDNNRSEAALRVVALGRKNFLFVGNEHAGKNIAGLYTIVATCEASDVNPLSYLTDVLLRVGSHPNSDIDALLPAAWAAACDA